MVAVMAAAAAIWGVAGAREPVWSMAMVYMLGAKGGVLSFMSSS